MKKTCVVISVLFLVFCNVAEAIVMDGLAGWWKFEESSGAIVDMTDNGNDGTYNGSLYQQGGWIDYGLGFDGTDDYVNIDGVVSYFSAVSGSIECWAKANSTATSYLLCGNTNTRTYLSISSGKFVVTKGNPYVSIPLGFANTNWNHIVLTWNNGVMAGYLNGELCGSASFLGDYAGSQLKIGSFRTGSGSHFNGIIDEVRIYDRALTAAEVSENYGYMQLDPGDCAIVLPDTTIQAQLDAGQVAADELQKHIELITGVTVGIFSDDSTVQDKYRFYVGNRESLNTPHSAKRIVGTDQTWFSGDDDIDTGSKIAVYNFIEKDFGVRWIEPGDDGIMYTPSDSLYITRGTYVWDPEFELRKIRSDAKVGQWTALTSSDITYDFRDFQRTETEHDAYAAEVTTWKNRMGMGSYSAIQYGHAFTTWWDTYGTSHPEYFALNIYGEREPETSDVTTVKLCVSNPAVVSQIIANWQAAGTKKYVNVCQNDHTYGYCRCANCQALDHPLPGESFGDHLSDRYVYFTNQVAIAAKAIRSDACAVMYAYTNTLQPPRYETLEPNVVVVAVPYTIKTAELQDLYEGWKDADAQTIGLRPNYPGWYQNGIFPTGFEEQMYNAFKTAYDYGDIVLADYDSLTGLWRPHGLTDYINAKLMFDPTKSYDELEDEYCSAFGNAASDVKAYYAYWRNFWETELLPNIDTIMSVSQGSFNRNMQFTLDTYYDSSDFDGAISLLQAGAAKNLTTSQSNMLNKLILANQHAKKAYLAMANYRVESYATDLLDFRIDNKDNLMAHNWIGMFWAELTFGDHASQDAAMWTQDWLDYYDALQYTNAIVTDGLVSWWKFNEASGTLTDTVGNNDGTYNGSLYQQTGLIDYALGFDGVDDNVNCGNDTSLQLTDDFTVEAWVNCAQFGTNLGIVTKQVTGAYGGWNLGRMTDNRFSALISNTTELDYVHSMFSYTSSDWHHLAMVVDDGTTYLYVDGVQQQDYSTKAISESGLDFVIGKTYPLYNSRYFNGNIDDVRVYNKALTAEEINQNYRYNP